MELGDRRSDDKVAALFEKRVETIKRQLVQAGITLEIAQHGDVLRHEIRRDGFHVPKILKFTRNDYVHVRQNEAGRPNLNMNVPGDVRRVHKVKPDGLFF